MFRKTNSTLWLLLLFFSLPASTEEVAPQKQSPAISKGSVEIEGDSLEILLDRKMKARGNAILKKDNKTIKSEIIEYDEVSEKLITRGDTSIELGNMSLKGSNLDFKLSDETGRIDNTTFKFESNKKLTSRISNGIKITKRVYDYRGNAKTIFFEGEDKKRMEYSRVTTCEADSNDWYLKTSQMQVNNKTERINGSNAIVEFKGVPILYTPYINFSLNNNRKSGFLTPTFGSTTKSGFDFQMPYYFNISPDKDATLTARYLGKRGPQADGEYRYMGENYSGKDKIQLMSHDEASGKDNRYFINLQHQHNFGNGWSGSYDFQKVSDNNYFSDLATIIQQTSVVNLPQRVNINYSSDNFKFGAVTEKYQTLTTIDNSPYQRLPQFNLSGKRDYGNYVTNFNSQWTYFDRDDKFKFTGNDKVTGSRLSLTPSITIPINQTYGYVKPKLSTNIRSYNLNNLDSTTTFKSQNIVTPIMSIDSGMYFDRSINIFNQIFTQTLEPRLFYVYIPNNDQKKLPLFDTGLSDLNMQTLFLENQFNGQDRINDANQLTAALTSKFIDNNGKERLTGIIAQRFYFDDRLTFLDTTNFNVTDSNKSNSDLFAGLTTRLMNNLNLDGMWQYDPSKDKILRNTISSRYNPEPGKIINLSYRKIDNVLDSTQSLKEINIAGQWPLGNRFYSIGRFNYDLKSSQTIETVAGIEYDGGCWAARTLFDRISLPTSPSANYTFFVQLELNGLGNIGTDPNKLNSFLYRNVPGARTVNQIPDANRQANFN